MLQLQQSLAGHSDRIWTLAWNPTGTILATSGGDKSIRLWAKKTDNWECISILTESHSKSIRRLCWSPCGQYLASASFDATVCIWKRNSLDGSWSTAVNLEGHESEVKSVAWSPNGNYLASCGRDKTIWIWERASDGEDSEENGDIEVWDCSDVKNDHSKDVKHVLWHPSNDILASCSYDDSIKLFHKNGEDWKCYQTLSSHTSTVWSADFSSSGEFLASCGDDKTVRIWKNHAHSKLPHVEPNSWKCVSVIQGYHSRSIYDLSWSRVGDFIVSASGDNAIAIYGRSKDDPTTVDTFVCLSKKAQAHSCDVNSIAWSPKDPNILASASDDRLIKIWKFNSDAQGMEPLTISDEIIQSIKDVITLEDNSSEDKQKNDQASHYSVNVTDLTHFFQITQTLQTLQDELCSYNPEKHSLENLFNLSIRDHPKPLKISGMVSSTEDGHVKELAIEISDSKCHVKYRFRLVLIEFELDLPRRSINLLALANDLFLFEKTGDLYKILPSGRSIYLLGHLFSFADVKFVMSQDSDSHISFILTADRDEKIRITNYPDTFEIERFCFGHKNLVREMYLAENRQFISIDQEDHACLWDISKIHNSSGPLRPVRCLVLGERTPKRMCLHIDQPANESVRATM